MFQGDYEIYIDNSYSHFSSKVVSVYILTFHSNALMEKYQKEQELNETTHIAKVYFANNKKNNFFCTRIL